MIKYFFIISSVLCALTTLEAQETTDCNLSIVSRSQEQFIKTLNKKEKGYYISIINLAKWVRPKVIGEIRKSVSSDSICASNKFNILEGYDLAHGDIYGLIWTDSIFFSYINEPSNFAGSNVQVKVKRLVSLSDSEKNIVANFGNWSNIIFKSRSNSPRKSNPPLYYLATRVNLEGKSDVKTLAFCY
jgi:hypothetical protein